MEKAAKKPCLSRPSTRPPDDLVWQTVHKPAAIGNCPLAFIGGLNGYGPFAAEHLCELQLEAPVTGSLTPFQ